MKRKGDIQRFFVKKQSVGQSRDSTDSYKEDQGQPECSQGALCLNEPTIQGQSSSHEPPGENTHMRKVMHLYLFVVLS
ncbi:uncharacterized protein V6R79_010057 [Siganus canaliculatus]